ncbi:MAG: barstar family protein [Acidobacteriota bacterium]|nr:barstar family protein [Acidobacteriota bacterium]
MTKFRLETKRITDWASFHLVCEEAFGFPAYYGRNMNAWIDCMSSFETDEEIIQVEITDTEDFNRRLPEIFDALVECTAFVNNRYINSGESIKIASVFL